MLNLRRSLVFIVNFEHISHIFLVLLFVDFEQVNVRCETCKNRYTNLKQGALTISFFKKIPNVIPALANIAKTTS